MSMKNSNDTVRNRTSDPRFVAQRLNHCATTVPPNWSSTFSDFSQKPKKRRIITVSPSKKKISLQLPILWTFRKVLRVLRKLWRTAAKWCVNLASSMMDSSILSCITEQTAEEESGKWGDGITKVTAWHYSVNTKNIRKYIRMLSENFCDQHSCYIHTLNLHTLHLHTLILAEYTKKWIIMINTNKFKSLTFMSNMKFHSIIDCYN